MSGLTRVISRGDRELADPSARTGAVEMSIFNSENIFDQFSENIPDACDDGEAYLGAVAKYAKQARVPVDADVTEESVGGGFRAERALFLVLTPTDRRLRRYPSYHYGRPIGTTLNVGWYLVGKVASGGLGGWAIAGGANQQDMDDLEALIHVVHETSVIPAMQEVAAATGFAPARE
jgi:hypothetical protein